MSQSFAAYDAERLGADAVAIARELNALADRAAGLMAELAAPWVRRYEEAAHVNLERPYATARDRMHAEAAFDVMVNHRLVFDALWRLQEMFPCDDVESGHATTWDAVAALAGP